MPFKMITQPPYGVKEALNSAEEQYGEESRAAWGAVEWPDPPEGDGTYSLAAASRLAVCRTRSRPAYRSRSGAKLFFRRSWKAGWSQPDQK